MDWNSIWSWIPDWLKGLVPGIIGTLALTAGDRWLKRGDRQFDQGQTKQVTSFSQLFQLYEQQQGRVTSLETQLKSANELLEKRNADNQLLNVGLKNANEAKDAEFDKERTDYERQLSTKRDEYTLLKISFNQMQDDNAQLTRENKRLKDDRNST